MNDIINDGVDLYYKFMWIDLLIFFLKKFVVVQFCCYLKKKKKTFVIAQDGDTCVVNGMPKSVVKAGLSDEVLPLPLIAQEIILHVGVKWYGC